MWQLLKRIWAAWTRLAHKIGNFNARVLLTLLYCVILMPIGLLVRLLADPLRIKKLPSQWLDHANETMDLQWAKRQ